MDNLVKKMRGTISQAKLAKITGISQQSIAQYELGRFARPDKLKRIAAATGYRVIITVEKIENEDKDNDV